MIKQRLPIAMLYLLRAVGLLWTAPNTLLGLLAGIAALPFGARVRLSRRECALVFNHMPWGPGGALTLGNTILHTGPTLDAPCVTYAHRAGHRNEAAIVLADHERAHVFQYMALGPLFLPLYGLCGGIDAENRFEQSADFYALNGHGWWPWRVAKD
jgi:hypothetical protein